MKKILQINSVANWGSTGHIAEDIGHFAIQNGWQSFIAYGRKARLSSSSLIKIGSKLNFLEELIHTRLFDKHSVHSKRATKKFVDLIDSIKPDIIHLHNLHGYYLNFVILLEYISKKKIPVVWTFHDCWPITGHCTHFEFVNCNRWMTECKQCPQKKKYPASFLKDNCTDNYSLKRRVFRSIENLEIVAVSDWLADKVQKSFLSETHVTVINNGIDLKTFIPNPDHYVIRSKYGIPNKFMLLGVASSWTVSKGLDDYYKLSNIIPDDIIIVLVGLSRKEIKNLPKNIIGIPRTESASDLSHLYSTADIVLNLSYEESFGLTTVEGFACGTPGIVYNSTASPELMSEGTGYIVEKGEMVELLDKISHIKKNGKDKYTNNCRKRAEQKYNKESQVKNYMELYKSLLKI